MAKQKKEQPQKEVRQIQYIAVSDLTKHPQNEDLRTITNEDFDRLVASLELEQETGYFESRPCIVSNRTGESIILAGNQRYEAAKHLGWDSVPCMVLEGLTEDQELRVLVKDNGSFGQWNHDGLSSLFDAPTLSDWGVPAPAVFDGSALDETDFSGKNKEIDTDDFSDKMTIKLEYTHEDFIKVQKGLSDIGITAESALYKFLFGE